MKNSASAVYKFLRRSRKWCTAVDVIRSVATVNPSARLSELDAEGMIVKRPAKNGPCKIEYRAVTT